MDHGFIFLLLIQLLLSISLLVHCLSLLVSLFRRGHIVLVIFSNDLLVLFVVHALHLGWGRPVISTSAHHVLTCIAKTFQVDRLLLLNVVHVVDLLVVVLPTSSVVASSLHLRDLISLLFASFSLLSLFLFLFFLLLSPLLFSLFLLLDLEVVLHLLDDETLPITLVENSTFLVQKCFLVIGVEHFFKQFLAFLKIAILHNLMCFIAEPEQQACEQEKQNRHDSCNDK